VAVVAEAVTMTVASTSGTTMTERALPSIGVGIRPRPAAEAQPGPSSRSRGSQVADAPASTAADRAAALRRETILFTPARVGMLLGASAALYAVTLAGVSALQAQDDAALAASRTPYLDALAEARAANDVLEARIQAANARIAGLITTYDAVGSDVEAFQTRLDELATLVADVRGSAAALPARIKLPTVSMRGAVSSGVTRSSAPRTSGKSGASGG
jgi:hypothetical protein